MTGTAAWVAQTEPSTIDVGLGTADALALARDFLMRLREGDIDPPAGKLGDAAVDVLHAAIEVIAGASLEDAEGALQDACRLRDFISAAVWSEPDFAERAELLAACSLWGWRLARRTGKPAVADGFARRIPAIAGSIAEAVHDFKADPLATAAASDRAMHNLDVGLIGSRLEEPGILLELCGSLREKLDSSPLEVQEQAEAVYRFISAPMRSIGVCDEHDYFLCDFALLAGTACRILARREEAVRWFELAGGFAQRTGTAIADSCRVSYQRLALLVEERRFSDLLGQLGALTQRFRNLNMREHALKCRFLEGLALSETGDFSGAASVFRSIRDEAKSQGNENLLGQAYVNLVHVRGLVGDVREALAASQEALAVMRKLGNARGLAKIQFAVGILLRNEGRLPDAIGAVRSSQAEFESLGMKAEAAAGSLVVAEMFLELDQEENALREVLAALPIINEFKLGPEGMAALALLHESVRQQKINHQALRDLHGFFEDTI